MSCFIYCRVSSQNQAEKGYGIDYQERLCRGMADLKDLEVINVYKDLAISGSKSRRPSMDAMFDDLNGKIGYIIVYSLDRIGRSARLILEIIDRLSVLQCSLVSCKESIDTSTQGGKFFLTVMAGLTELEKETIKEKTYAGRVERMKLDGESGGRLPFGYRRVKDTKGSKRSRVEIDEQAAHIVQLIFELDADDLFPADIADELNRRGYKTSTGKQWYAKAIIRIKRNAHKYRGCYRSTSKVRWPRLLSDPCAPPSSPV